MRLDGTRVRFIAGASVEIKSTASRDTDTTLRGLDATVSSISAVQPTLEKDESTGQTFSNIVVPDEFPRGSILVFTTWMDDLPTDLDDVCARGAKEAVKGLNTVDLNVLLYRADGEERDASKSSSLSFLANTTSSPTSYSWR